MSVFTGLDIFLKKNVGLVNGKRVALLCHAASVTHDLKLAHHVFFGHRKINLVKLFAPEHGLFGVAQDMESVANASDPVTGLSVSSLYGSHSETLELKESDLANVDVFVVDLQDSGSRYYTFIYTMALCLKVCGKLKIPVIVLDRPNPLGGEAIEGNLLNRKFSSFVGLYPLPVRHGMTIGELAAYFNATENFGCDLTVIKMQGWKRNMYFDATGLAFVPPSPNMPRLATALVYPGLCLIEATNISEGRGTTMPFEWIGAPFIDALKITNALHKLKLPGVVFRPIQFKPNYQKQAGQVCNGFQIHVTNRKIFKSYQTGIWIVKTLAELYPSDFKWRDKPYEFVSDIPAIDLLTGDAFFRENLNTTAKIKKWIGTWQKDENDFTARRKEFLLY